MSRSGAATESNHSTVGLPRPAGSEDKAMSQENEEVIVALLKRSNRDGAEAALAGLAPDVEYHDLPDEPDAGLHHATRAFSQPLRSSSGDYSVNLDGIIDHGEQIVVGVRVIGRGRSSGARFEQRATGIWTLRNGFVMRVVWFGTREEALEAVGLSE